MKNNLNTHVYILVLEKYMNAVFNNQWAKDVVFLIVKMINDKYVNVDSGFHHAIIFKNGKYYVCNSYARVQNILDRNLSISEYIKHRNILKFGCNSFRANFIINDEWYEWNKWFCDRNYQNCCNVGEHSCIRKIEYQNENCKIMITNISDIVCGAYHTFCVMKDGSLYVFGCNREGQLGLGDYKNSEILVKLNLVVNSVTTKYSHSFAFTKDGRVLGWGRNNNNQLGRDGVNNVPLELMLSNVIYICCGCEHSFAIVKFNNFNDKLYICGKIKYDDLNGASSSPRELKLFDSDWTYHIMSIVCGRHEIFALINNGDAYCWHNDYSLNYDNYVNTTCLPVKLSICNVRLLKGGWNHNIFVTNLEEIFYRDSAQIDQINPDQYKNYCDAQQLLRIDI